MFIPYFGAKSGERHGVCGTAANYLHRSLSLSLYIYIYTPIYIYIHTYIHTLFLHS